jgi:DNA modification methylase
MNIGRNSFDRQQIAEVGISTLKAPRRKLRNHPEHQIELLTRGVIEFGQSGAIVVDDDMTIINGVAVWEACKRAGFETVTVAVASHLSKPQLRQLRLAHNRLAEEASWNFPELKLEFQEILSFDPGDIGLLDLTGFTTAEIDTTLHIGEPDLDPVDEDEERLPSNPVSRLDDLWQIGAHYLYCGDAKSSDSYAKLLRPGEVADLIACDPPFNIKVKNISGRGRTKHSEFVEASGEMTAGEFATFLTAFLEASTAAARPGALVYAFMDWRQIHLLVAAGVHLGLHHNNICVWSKGSGGMGGLYRSSHELCTVFSKPGADITNNVKLGKHGRNRTNVWTIPGMNRFSKDRNELLAAHPTVKPIALIAEIIRDASNRGDIVLDPFAGSGTTLIAAERCSRVARCMELDPRYIDVAIERCRKHLRVEAVHVGTGLTFREIAEQRRQQTSDDTSRARRPRPACSAEQYAKQHGSRPLSSPPLLLPSST